MLKYTAQRILFFIPTVFIISVFTFLLIRAVPGDMADTLIRNSTDESSVRDHPELYEKKYREKARELGTDLPSFFIEIGTAAMPRSLSYEWNPVKKQVLRSIILQTGNSDIAYEWYGRIESYNHMALKFGKSYPDKQEFIDVDRELSRLLYLSDTEEINTILIELRSIIQSESPEAQWARNRLNELTENIGKLSDRKEEWKNYIPLPRFHADNAYGNWLLGNGKNSRGILFGDFGTSIINGKPVKDSLSEKIGLTLFISLLSILLAYFIAVPIGVFSALYKDSVGEKMITVLLFLLFTLPSFWVASLCIMWLTGGDGLNWFASYGPGKITDDMGIAEIIHIRWRHFALPIFVWTYGGLAFISKQTQTAVLENAGSWYVKSAVARGLSLRTVLFHHLLPNSLRPLITMGANILPALIGGSVILETLFSLPGMGEWAYRAYLTRDFPVIMAVVFFGSVLTLTGYLISDILIAWTDPRIKFQAK